MNQPPPFKGLNIRIPILIILIPTNGRGCINQGSGLGEKQAKRVGEFLNMICIQFWRVHPNLLLTYILGGRNGTAHICSDDAGTQGGYI